MDANVSTPRISAKPYQASPTTCDAFHGPQVQVVDEARQSYLIADHGDNTCICNDSPIVAEAGRQCHGPLWSPFSDVCKLLRIPTTNAAQADSLLFQHVQFKAGQRVHTFGQAFEMLYAVNSGFLKTVLVGESGKEQILSFPMKGDVIGVDGIYSRQYATDAVTLSDCDVILIPFRKLAALGRTHSDLENLIYGVMSRELAREQEMIATLGALSADARVARFLMKLADRFEKLGYSNKEFNLRMTRQEIGSYLGLTLETVSRTLSAFGDLGLISVDQRTIGIRNAEALRHLRRLPPSYGRRQHSLTVDVNVAVSVEAST